MKISVLIPCHNEKRSVAACIESCLNQTVPPDEIVVVDDGSTDDSKNVIRKFGKRVKLVALAENTGNKSLAQEKGLKHVTGDVVIMTDADTVLHFEFIEKTKEAFTADRKKTVAAVAGRVISMKHNWVTASRAIDYAIGFDIFKQAQSAIGYVFVMPGCATAMRTDVLRSLSFNHDTVTEDLDFTYQIHLKGLHISYVADAIVYTQDPPNIPSYVRQMRRWYCGGWQNLIKYYPVIFRKPIAAVELTLMFGEGLLYSLFLTFLMLIYPEFFFLRIIPFYFVITFLFSAYAAVRDKRPELVLYFPAYLFIVFLNAGISMYEFFREVVLRKQSLVWLKADRV
ncbi:MAG: glycosyltransferase family 2 protein [Candidatus Moranbacteria bacterium]|nr:glycosyltransferase family 2 protein [Candidatus Moranbacteria bacterium]